MQELGEELKSGEKVLEEVQNIGDILKEEDTSVDYTVELDKLLDTFSILADTVSAKTVRQDLCRYLLRVDGVISAPSQLLNDNLNGSGH